MSGLSRAGCDNEAHIVDKRKWPDEASVAPACVLFALPHSQQRPEDKLHHDGKHDRAHGEPLRNPFLLAMGLVKGVPGAMKETPHLSKHIRPQHPTRIVAAIQRFRHVLGACTVVNFGEVGVIVADSGP